MICLRGKAIETPRHLCLRQHIAMREVKMLKEMKHENIVHLKEAFQRRGKLYLVFEYLEFDLKKYMKKKGAALPPEQTQSFLY